MVANIFTSSSATTVYLAGLSGDGTSNGALANLVNRGLMAAAVVFALIFGYKLITTYLSEKSEDGSLGGSKAKAMISEGFALAVAEGLIASVWLIINYGQQIIGGIAG